MRLTFALSSALSGLSATSRQAEVLSSNVANAATPGYARRDVGLRSAEIAGVGQGVAVTNILRDVDRQLLAERRLAQSGDGDRALRAGFATRVEQKWGHPTARAPGPHGWPLLTRPSSKARAAPNRKPGCKAS